MKFNVLTLFPEMIHDAFKEGVVGQAAQKKIIEVNTVNPRNFTEDIHKTIDDRPFGGGDGMVLKFDPWKLALDSLGLDHGPVVLLSPHGKAWDDSTARAWAASNLNLTLVCGRYAGFDQRFINTCVDHVVSIGDFVLSGGELAALVMIDTMARFMPKVLGNLNSPMDESFSEGLLEAPLFTRPQEVAGQRVPQFLLSGNHKQINRNRRLLSLVITHILRPELITNSHRAELAKLAKFSNEISGDEWRACGVDPDVAVRVISENDSALSR